MPQVYPFSAVQYKGGEGDVSSLVAPPYDVLDAAAKKRLLAGDAHNIVAIDLPHTPAKELGPASAYENAAGLYRAWLKDGTLSRSAASMFAYRQTFRSGERVFQRSGMACCVETVPFGPRSGGGILAHEETFSGPKEDRFALMKATRAQLSPIFGLHADDSGRATALLHSEMRGGPAMKADMGDGVLHEAWTVRSPATVRAYQDALAGEDVFIADGHHRYTTGLNYLKELESRGSVAADHGARRCMMVLVGMSDPGLVIWPTHRVLGGMKGYSIGAFIEAAKGLLDARPAGNDIHALEGFMASEAPTRVDAAPANIFGLYDFTSGECFTATPRRPDPLLAQFPAKPSAWRRLDVAIIQHLIVERVCEPKLNGGEPVKWAFPHTIPEVVEIGRGAETGAGGGANFAQLAVIVRPTPLSAVKAISRANQLMPQKSTFFFPKLATGLFINPLE